MFSRTERVKDGSESDFNGVGFCIEIENIKQFLIHTFDMFSLKKCSCTH